MPNDRTRPRNESFGRFEQGSAGINDLCNERAEIRGKRASISRAKRHSYVTLQERKNLKKITFTLILFLERHISCCLGDRCYAQAYPLCPA